MSQTYLFERVLTESGWANMMAIEVDDQGLITKTSANASTGQKVPGWLIPGFQNAHSHSFQYAMAGLAEHMPAGAKGDDFWSWRQSMYSLAQKLDPDQFQAIATMLYAEMLYHGITHVAEFHYLHHDKNGTPYSNIAEMGQRLVAAAESTGMSITLLPVLYQNGGFGKPPLPEQARFVSKDLDSYFELLDASKKICDQSRRATLGIALHSLRAVAKESIAATLKYDQHLPVHIHVAEQQKEVQDCLDHLKAEPIDWLLDNCDLDGRWHLIHATHMQPQTVIRLAKSKASVVLCPQTEGNLGDGFFPLQAFRQNGGAIGIGTDSHIGLSPLEDLRWIDYGQRLKAETRNIICQKSGQDSGMEIFNESWVQGRKAVGENEVSFFEIGAPLDGVVLNPKHPIFLGKPDHRIMSSLIYGGDARCYLSTLKYGEAVVSGGRHHAFERICETYQSAIEPKS